MLVRADRISTKSFGRDCSRWRERMGNGKYRSYLRVIGLAAARHTARSRACWTTSRPRMSTRNEGHPGLAKTLIARLFGEALDLSFKRIQFTPDLLPGDITGSFLYDQRQAQFEFRRGPIFTQLLLADEINRATPKTQSALLEAMQEGQVTVEGQSFPLEMPFLVIATQNPIDLEGTYALPEAQLDRFIMRVAVGYPGRDEEREILARRRTRRVEEAHVAKIVPRDQVLAMQAALEDVHVDASIEEYIVDLARATREDPRVALGA